MAEPVTVSIIMPNYNCGRYVEAAIQSALTQTLTSVEVIFVDDCSKDDSVERAKAMAERWPGQVKVFVQDRNQGSAAARNRALREASGKWLAVLDSDDLMYPDRLRLMIELAEVSGADIVSDDMLTFYDDRSKVPHRLLTGPFSERDRWVDLATFIEENRWYSKHAALGYLKPVIRADRWRESGVFYDESLPLAQDYNYIQRLLEAGLTYLISPRPWYFYRKHTASNSHRTKAGAIEALQAADQSLKARLPAKAVRERLALEKREASLQDTLSFAAAVEALKGRRLAKAARITVERPSILRLYLEPVKARLARLSQRLAPADSDRETVMLLTCQGGQGLGLSERIEAAGYAVQAIEVAGGAPPRDEDILQIARLSSARLSAIVVADAGLAPLASAAIRPDIQVLAADSEDGLAGLTSAHVG